MSAVIDHHVDRTDVEAPQGVQLTVTNCTIALSSIPACRDGLIDFYEPSRIVQSRSLTVR